jgi:hypothetical protein
MKRSSRRLRIPKGWFPRTHLLPENLIILSTEKVSECIQINVYMILNDCYLL